MMYCPDCCTQVDESDQSLQDYKDGVCPYCGGSNVAELPEDPAH